MSDREKEHGERHSTHKFEHIDECPQNNIRNKSNEANIRAI